MRKRRLTFIIILATLIFILNGCIQTHPAKTKIVINESNTKLISNLNETIEDIGEKEKEEERHTEIKHIASIEQKIAELKRERKEEERRKSEKSISVIALGDNLIHMPVLKAGKQSDGTYNYEYMYERIKEELQEADVKIINQETILVNEASNYSSYPAFGSPIEIGEALINSGFNVVTHATNHSYDKGVKGIEQTVEFWNKHIDTTTMIGVYTSQETYENVSIQEYNGIKIAFLNYTYGLNGLRLPQDKKYLVKTLDNKEEIMKELQYADANADCVIVLPHWGTEYVYKPTNYQKEWAQIFIDNGADCIIGTHPHVVEPLELYYKDDGSIIPCYYSLGNSISSQDEQPRALGGMASFTITKNGEKTIIQNCEIKPIITYIKSGRDYFQVCMLEDYTKEMANEQWLTGKGYDMNPNTMKDLFDSIVVNN